MFKESVSGDHQKGHGSLPKVPEFTRFARDLSSKKPI
jgi:hypothetical protein